MKKPDLWQSEFVDKLRNEIKRSNLTAYRLQVDTGVPHQTINNFARDGKQIRFDMAAKLMIRLGMVLLSATSAAKLGCER